jgi:hypothetical protein
MRGSCPIFWHLQDEQSLTKLWTNLSALHTLYCLANVNISFALFVGS